MKTTLAQVLVVGAGPVGLTLATELARRGVAVRVIDQNTGIVPHSRAILLHARTLEIFSDMGVLEGVLQAGQVIHGGSIFSGGERVLHFDLDGLASPYRFAIDLPQSETERILAENLERLGVDIERRTTLSGFNQDASGVTAYLRRDDGSAESVRFDYIAGCDGAQSTVRHTLGLHFDGESTPENFLVADVRLDWNEPDDEWSIWFHEAGMMSVFPMPGRIYRVVADAGFADATEKELLRVWETRVPVAAKPHDPLWISSLRVNYRKVSEYRSGRVFVAGDAAHVQSPAGGQGMNTGIQDANNLAWKLALVLGGKSPDGLLDSYTKEREPIAGGVLDLTNRMTSIATWRHPVSQSIRNRVVALLAGFEVIEQRVINRVGETTVNYRQSPIVTQVGHWYGAAPQPGDRAPGVENILRSPRFKVVAFTAGHAHEELLEPVAVLSRYIRDGYGDDADFWLVARNEWEGAGAFIEDPEGILHQRYGATVPCVYVVRPDNYIGFRSLGLESLPVLGYFGEIFDAEPKAVELGL